ncbi:hypothetical protein H4R20_000669 [Coemansia guatemalensis]|uniref:Uncharacterized protein n=1 Tax=Coemansia guatemalensis TaxID=2761395 RepID=A0A9W8I0N9_9FUNG|nr:hypothetical protein H4R20_000669 [Coemansia guatemalensis]
MGGFIFGDQHARRRILWGTVGLGSIGAVVGLNLAILRNLQPIRRHTLTMAANWTVYGVFFFTTREALLAEQKQKNEELHLRHSQTRDSDELFSSAISGALTGSVLGFIARRTRAAAVSGALLFSAVSAAGQMTFTAFNRRRQLWIIQKMGLAKAKEEEKVEGSVENKESSSVAARLRRMLSADPIAMLPDWFPVRRISSDEYRTMLNARREELLFEIRQLQDTIASMSRREQVLLSRLREEESAHDKADK